MQSEATATDPGARRASPNALALALTAGLVLAVLASLSSGAVPIPVGRALAAVLLEPLGLVDSGLSVAERAVVLSLRAPRVALAALVGAGLGGAGAAVQGLFRNPLADPGLVGVSAGASLGAALAIVLGAPVFAALPAWGRPALIPLAAFGGGALVTLLVLRLAGRGARPALATVLLAGVAINALVGSCVGLLSQVADDAQLRDLVFWTLGGLGHASWLEVAATAPWILGTVASLPALGRALDLLALGEREARYLGVDVGSLERRLVAAVVVAVGAAVAVAGLVGFVGLVVPHVVRRIVGPRHRALLPLSSLGGAVLVLGADSLARAVVAPAELPIGLFTAALGAPFFLALLLQEARRA